ncbi:MAG TPA: cation diffusion facilitator family transporter [Salinisphaeraceae bacterium]|nr:cation diffusion facilitator family transporter [Salinisphaeraceae bacterium]
MSEHSHHGHAHSHGGTRVLLFAMLFTMAFALVEALGGWWAHSLALLSDAGHMLTDSSSLAIGAVAAWLAQKPASRLHSFGLQRAEVLGALINALFMIVVVVAIVVAAIGRLSQPAPVAGMPVMVIALIGLGVNMAVAAVLMRGEQTLNVRGALLHVFGDMLGSVAALIAGSVILLTGWTPIDPLLSLLVSVLISISAVNLLREVINVLMEGVPRNLNVAEVGDALAAVDGVQAVHDLHVWSLSSQQQALAAHVEITDLSDWCRILPQLQRLLAERFAITHTTLQPEDQHTVAACLRDIDCGLSA